ncbi:MULTISPECIES: YsnF/AvaK domain-containing protein [unclassified Caballeronia]|uniref:YsnF/AvaK domain-containing protein n=1 Tax=unclassified Caballeronia TaxID=2646786 RepID=UPI0020278646|nr:MULTISPECIES: YsnF/AvaK domain-containing protein [unclassified Caballeronia]
MSTQNRTATGVVETSTLTATEERLHVSTETLETGMVRVRVVTHTESREVPVVLHNRTARIERVALNRFVDAEFAPRHEGDTLVVPVFEYVPVTELRLMLKEEIRITTVVTEKNDVHRAELQRQEVVVERRAGTVGDWIADPAIPSSGSGKTSS